MNVGVYVDGFNLYYGGRSLCGRGSSGWRWLDIRGLVTPYVGWVGADVVRIVYCTARVDQMESPDSRVDQDVYISVLQQSGSVTYLEEGRFVSRAKAGPLVTAHYSITHPALYHATGDEDFDSALPLAIEDDPQLGQVVMATVRRWEEKGSDVNVAAHLLRDVLTGAVDAAVVITNDSDLGVPLRMAREVVPVGTINPQRGFLAGSLRGTSTDGVGRHWWRQLSAQDFFSHQLPNPVGECRKPRGW